MAFGKALRSTAGLFILMNVCALGLLGLGSEACSDDGASSGNPNPTPGNDGSLDVVADTSVDTSFNTQPDAGDAGPPCDLSKDYEAPTLITSPKEIFSVRFVKNEGLAFVTAACVGLGCSTGKDVFTTILKGTPPALDTFLPLPSASTPTNDESATLTLDGKTLVMSVGADSDAASLRHLVRYVDPGTGFQSDNPSLVPATPAADDIEPYLLPDQTLYFASNRLVRNQTYQIFRAAHTAAGSYDEPVAINVINIGGTDQQFPVATADDSVVYFSSARAPTLGGFDIWRSTRTGADLGEPVHVDALSSAGLDLVTWVSPDTCHVYLISDREGGSRKLYRASRPAK